jgi:hypothetical protein
MWLGVDLRMETTTKKKKKKKKLLEEIGLRAQLCELFYVQ